MVTTTVKTEHNTELHRAGQWGHLVAREAADFSCSRSRGPGSPQLTRRLGLAAYLDALDALSDDVGVMHGHQGDLDARHPAHSGRPHSCGQSAQLSSATTRRGSQLGRRGVAAIPQVGHT